MPPKRSQLHILLRLLVFCFLWSLQEWLLMNYLRTVFVCGCCGGEWMGGPYYRREKNMLKLVFDLEKPKYLHWLQALITAGCHSLKTTVETICFPFIISWCTVVCIPFYPQWRGDSTFRYIISGPFFYGVIGELMPLWSNPRRSSTDRPRLWTSKWLMGEMKVNVGHRGWGSTEAV